jgi:hypothetical protein
MSISEHGLDAVRFDEAPQILGEDKYAPADSDVGQLARPQQAVRRRAGNVQVSRHVLDGQD